MWGFNVFVHSVNSNYVSFGRLRPHTHVPNFMQMSCCVWDGAVTAKTRPAKQMGFGSPLRQRYSEYTSHNDMNSGQICTVVCLRKLASDLVVVD